MFPYKECGKPTHTGSDIVAILRVIADGLIDHAEHRPKRSVSRVILRDCAAQMLEAVMAIEKEDMSQ